MENGLELMVEGEKVELFNDSTIDVVWENEMELEEVEICFYIKDNEKWYIAIDWTGAYFFEGESLEELKAEIEKDGHTII